jgi:hypothetical protein
VDRGNVDELFDVLAGMGGVLRSPIRIGVAFGQRVGSGLSTQAMRFSVNLGCLGDGDSDVVILGALPIVAFPKEPCHVSHEVHLEFEAEGLLEGSLNVVAIREVCSPFAKTW